MPWFQFKFVGTKPGWQNFNVDEATTVLLSEFVAERPGDSKITDPHPRCPCGNSGCNPAPMLRPFSSSAPKTNMENNQAKASSATALPQTSCCPVEHFVFCDRPGWISSSIKGMRWNFGILQQIQWLMLDLALKTSPITTTNGAQPKLIYI